MKTNNSTIELEDSYLEQHFNRIKSYNKPKSYWLKPIKGWRDNLDLYITNKLDNDISEEIVQSEVYEIGKSNIRLCKIS